MIELAREDYLSRIQYYTLYKYFITTKKAPPKLTTHLTNLAYQGPIMILNIFGKV